MAFQVRRGDPGREAKDQSFRYRKDLGLPNQVCLFRLGAHSVVAAGQQESANRTSSPPLHRVPAARWLVANRAFPLFPFNEEGRRGQQNRGLMPRHRFLTPKLASLRCSREKWAGERQ
jgi:hypothetical protein